MKTTKIESNTEKEIAIRNGVIRYNEQNKATEPNDESIKAKECI